jgi:hypothetical protein
MSQDSGEDRREHGEVAPVNPRRRVVLWICLWAAGVAAACVVLLVLPPGPHGVYPPCPFHWATGLYCPGCGTLRCLYALLHGHLFAALRCNALTVAVLCGFAWAGARMAIRELAGAGRDPAWTPVPLVLIRVLAPAMVVFTVLRNIPVWPLSLLSPGG